MKTTIAVALLLAVLATEADSHGGCISFRGPPGEVPPGVSGSRGPSAAFDGAEWGTWWRRHAGDLLGCERTPTTLAWSSEATGVDPSRAAALMLSALDVAEGGSNRARIITALSSPGVATAARGVGAPARFRRILADASQPEIVRVAAAVALGRSGDASREGDRVLRRILAGEDSERVRAGAAIGPGLLRLF